MKKRVLFIVGDNLGLSREQIDYKDVEIVKFPVFVDGKEYRESDQYDAKWLISKYENEQVVAKSSTLVQKEIVDIVEKNRDRYDLIIHVIMSSGMSSATFVVAENVRKQYESIIPIINVDSRQCVNGVGNVLLGIIDMINNNDDLIIEEIKQKAQEVVDNTFSFFVFPDLNYLYKGGRIGKAKSLMGSILHIISIVGLMGDEKDGVVVPVGKGRTFKQVNVQLIEAIQKKMEERSVSRLKRAIIIGGYGDKNLDAMAELTEKVKAIPHNDLIIGHPGLVDAVYCGPGAYGVSVLI
jgi:DegV family protein with EDD domain